MHFVREFWQWIRKMAVVIAGIITGGILVAAGGYALHRLLNARRRRELEVTIEPKQDEKREQEIKKEPVPPAEGGFLEGTEEPPLAVQDVAVNTLAPDVQDAAAGGDTPTSATPTPSEDIPQKGEHATPTSVPSLVLTKDKAVSTCAPPTVPAPQVESSMKGAHTTPTCAPPTVATPEVDVPTQAPTPKGENTTPTSGEDTPTTTLDGVHTTAPSAPEEATPTLATPTANGLPSEDMPTSIQEATPTPTLNGLHATAPSQDTPIPGLKGALATPTPGVEISSAKPKDVQTTPTLATPTPQIRTKVVVSTTTSQSASIVTTPTTKVDTPIKPSAYTTPKVTTPPLHSGPKKNGTAVSPALVSELKAATQHRRSDDIGTSSPPKRPPPLFPKPKPSSKQEQVRVRTSSSQPTTSSKVPQNAVRVFPLGVPLQLPATRHEDVYSQVFVCDPDQEEGSSVGDQGEEVVLSPLVNGVQPSGSRDVETPISFDEPIRPPILKVATRTKGPTNRRPPTRR